MVPPEMINNVSLSTLTNFVACCLFVLLASLQPAAFTSLGAELYWQPTTVGLTISLITISLITLLSQNWRALFYCNFLTPAVITLYLMTRGLSAAALPYRWLLWGAILLAVMLNLHKFPAK